MESVKTLPDSSGYSPECRQEVSKQLQAYSRLCGNAYEPPGFTAATNYHAESEPELEPEPEPETKTPTKYSGKKEKEEYIDLPPPEKVCEEQLERKRAELTTLLRTCHPNEEEPNDATGINFSAGKYPALLLLPPR